MTEPLPSSAAGDPPAEVPAAENPNPAEAGVQPLDALMRAKSLDNHALVAASPVPITHKLVMRARRGRRLTPHSRRLVLAAWNAATGAKSAMEDLFDYS